MQIVNDDMDDLYRRAAEEYPLNTDSADWNAVLKKMQADDSEKAIAVPSKNKNYRQLLWLLLLLPLGLVYKNYFYKENKKSVETVSNNISNRNPGNVSLSTKINSSANNTVQNVDVTQSNTSEQLKTSPLVHRNVKGKLNVSLTESNGTTDVTDNSVPDNSTNTNKTIPKETAIVTDVTNKDAIENKNETAIKPADIKEDKTTADLKNEAQTTKSPQIKLRKQKEHGLYAGVVISPDISTIKFQSIKKVGVNMGVLVGYQFSNKVSVESGVLWDIKNYYSDGQYFSTKKIHVPSTVKIVNVSGGCHMIEIPLSIKYNFRSKGKTNFSATAGVSSYIMKKEDYVYQVVRNGSQYPYSSTYKNTSKDLFAAANLAVGYNRQIKKGTALRIEPYLKIPLKGVGIGIMPIMSTGLNIGITKKLSR